MSPKAVISGIFAAIALILVLSVVGGSFYTIDQGELGVLLRNGRAVGVAQPGLGFKVPFIDSVVTISTRTEKVSYPKVGSYSKDQQSADLAISVNLRIEPSRVVEVYSTYGHNGFVDRVLTPRVLEQSKNVFGQFNAVTAIQERVRLNSEIEDAIQKSVQGTGFIVESTQLENIDFSNAYEASIEARMQAEVEVQKLKQQLEQDKVRAEQKRVTAQGEADAKVSNAKADAEATRMRGEAEASSIVARGKALHDNPELVRLIQAEKWNGNLPTHMVPGSTVPFIELK